MVAYIIDFAIVSIRGVLVTLEVLLTPKDAQNFDFSGFCTVVVDVLRATTSMQAIFEGGGHRIFPVSGVEDAFDLKKDSAGALLCGERDGFPPPGFDMGNSPFAFSTGNLRHRDVILTTTNGTLAVSMAALSTTILSACLLNASAVARKIIERKEKAVCIFCAGTEGRYSIEDVYAAGRIAAILVGYDAEATDAAWSAVEIARRPVAEVVNADSCRHLRILLGKGFEKDVEYALRHDVSTIVPEYDNRARCFYPEGALLHGIGNPGC